MAVMRTVSGGYFLVRGAEPRTNREILPQVVWTPSDCVCDRYPYFWCEPDLLESFGNPEEALRHMGLASSHLPAMKAWVASQEQSGRLGYSGVFIECGAAKEFAASFLRWPAQFKLLGIGLPVEYVETFLNETLEWVRETPNCGVFQSVSARQEIAVGGTSVGYEPLGYEPCTVHGLSNHISEDWPVRRYREHLNEHGRFSDLQTCIQAVDAQVEQAVWAPWLIVEYPIVVQSV